jgi:hypothetical protein
MHLNLAANPHKKDTVYSAEISRSNPTCFVFLVDQSASMLDRIGGENQRKCDVVADALNRLLSELAIKCAKEEGVRDYFHVSVIGYGAKVGPALSGSLAGRDLVPLSEVAGAPARLEERTKKVPDGAGGLIELEVKFPIWVDPVGQNGTPMTAAFRQASGVLSGWLATHPDCFPPVVLNLTDGEANDGDPGPVAGSVRQLASTDGEVLVFNLHVSDASATPIIFPSSEVSLPNDYARGLFNMSSVLPAGMQRYAQQQGLSAAEGSRGFVFNADVSAVVQFLDIGTRASDLR